MATFELPPSTRDLHREAMSRPPAISPSCQSYNHWLETLLQADLDDRYRVNDSCPVETPFSICPTGIYLTSTLAPVTESDLRRWAEEPREEVELRVRGLCLGAGEGESATVLRYSVYGEPRYRSEVPRQPVETYTFLDWKGVSYTTMPETVWWRLDGSRPAYPLVEEPEDSEEWEEPGCPDYRGNGIALQASSVLCCKGMLGRQREMIYRAPIIIWYLPYTGRDPSRLHTSHLVVVDVPGDWRFDSDVHTPEWMAHSLEDRETLVSVYTKNEVGPSCYHYLYRSRRDPLQELPADEDLWLDLLPEAPALAVTQAEMALVELYRPEVCLLLGEEPEEMPPGYRMIHTSRVRGEDARWRLETLYHRTSQLKSARSAWP